MNELATQTTQLPNNIEDLAKFALVGREKLAAVRAEINAIKKVGLAKEVLEQKRSEAQEIAELVTLSEVKIGKMLKEIPKATPNNNPHHEIRTDAELVKPKAEVIKEIGIKPDTAERFQRMAENEDVVMEAIEDAKRNDDIVSRSAVLKKITDKKLQPLRELKNREVTEAKKRHADFEDRKTESVVSFADITQDKEDINTLSVEFMIKVSKILTSIFAMHISGKTDEEMDSLVESEKDVQFTLGNLMAAEKALSMIRTALERRMENGNDTRTCQGTHSGSRKSAINNWN